MTRKLDTWLQQILNWLNDPAQASEPPLDPHGTVFQQQVWQALRRIPCGQTRQYGELAKELGSHARAVANACARNPIALLVPCHRVVGSKGLTGYRWGLQRKAALLELERAQHANLTSPPLPHVQ
ncbi:O-6-methylguanine DNA methyltransferase [Azomonas macrocytogenes]|uniref:methylated-DNA--[protein]-cysteine S-methyltransferase n=1 Tax=Azomonas macrocytogenes TaxID=69962 RepID=A0A839T1K4_AZOMA|nr:O-6-methylguanine DNA methyltransferase [Azomonas macrocytogenes]